jgi:hypothetical protein
MYVHWHWGYTERIQQRKRNRLIAAISAALGTAVVVAWLFVFVFPRQLQTHSAAVAAITAAPVKETPKAPSFVSAEGHYLFNGTVFWGRAIERDARTTKDPGHALGNLGTFNRQNYDAWIADLECPAANVTVPYQRQVALLNFNCPPEFAPSFIKYFNILNLANNHTGDQGRAAFLETQQNLSAAGAQVYGSYDPSDDTNRCEIISLPIKLQKSDTSAEPAAIQVAFCAYHYVGRQPRPGELEFITKYARIMPTIAFAHMGIEYTPAATPYQVAVGHGMIDAGADFVVMNHPHWVQNSEAYKGKLIMYSTGNFIFDQLTSEELRSASLDVTLSTSYDQNLAKWVQLTTDCKAGGLHDGCLAAAELAQLKKPLVTYKFGLVAGDAYTKRWIPQKADAAIQQAVEQRTNWAQTLQNIH